VRKVLNQLTEDFQNKVKSLLIRHQSILDILSKSQEASARVNRAVVKSVTNCGCIGIDAHKKVIPSEATLSDLKDFLNNHIDGQICDNCRDIIMTELGKQFFYIAALANALNISLPDVISKEEDMLATLTVFNLT